jgi:hypothetical protein
MAKPYRLKEAQVLCKPEAVPGTAETLATADQFLAQDIKFSPSFGDTANAGQTGVLSKEPGVSGMRTGTLSFKIALKGQNAAGSAPESRDALMSCGLSETISGGVSVTYAPAAPESYYTYGLIVPGLGGAGEDILFRLAGCQANGKLTWKVGEPLWWEVTATGVWAAPADSSVVTAPTWDTTQPSAFLNPAVVFHGTSNLVFETLELDMGNAVSMRPNANDANSSGGLTAQITDRRVTGSVDFEAEKLATFNIWTRVGSNTTGAISMTAIGAAGNKVALACPKIRFMSPDFGDRSGVATTPVKFEALRSSNAGNDEFSLIFT